MLIGYARVSTTEQNIESQIGALHEAGCEKGFADRGIGGDTIRRPEFNKLIEQLREGDIVAFTALDRLARNLRFLLEILETINITRRGSSPSASPTSTRPPLWMNSRCSSSASSPNSSASASGTESRPACGTPKRAEKPSATRGHCQRRKPVRYSGCADREPPAPSCPEPLA